MEFLTIIYSLGRAFLADPLSWIVLPVFGLLCLLSLVFWGIVWVRSKRKRAQRAELLDTLDRAEPAISLGNESLNQAILMLRASYDDHERSLGYNGEGAPLAMEFLKQEGERALFTLQDHPEQGGREVIAYVASSQEWQGIVPVIQRIAARLGKNGQTDQLQTPNGRQYQASFQRQIGAIAYLRNAQEALTAFTKAAEEEPGNPENLLLLGIVLQRLGYADTAFGVLQKALELGDSLKNQMVATTAETLLNDLSQIAYQSTGA